MYKLILLDFAQSKFAQTSSPNPSLPNVVVRPNVQVLPNAQKNALVDPFFGQRTAELNFKFCTGLAAY